jgi:hypothetical protein
MLLACGLLAGLVGATGCMPLFPSPPGLGLNGGQVNAIVGCQKTIHIAGQKFVSTKLKELESCVLEIVGIRLLWENELIDGDSYDSRIESARRSCDRRFAQITRASTRFVDSVIDACEPVEEWILDGDSLRFLLLEEEAGFVDTESVVGLAGSLCGIKELLVDQLIFFQMPRLLELLEYLGEGYVDFTGENDYAFGVPDIRLDERCITGAVSETLSGLVPGGS